jgi:hypothetical protein
VASLKEVVKPIVGYAPKQYTSVVSATWEAEAGESRVWDYLGNLVRPDLKENKKDW